MTTFLTNLAQRQDALRYGGLYMSGEGVPVPIAIGLIQMAVTLIGLFLLFWNS